MTSEGPSKTIPTPDEIPEMSDERARLLFIALQVHFCDPDEWQYLLQLALGQLLRSDPVYFKKAHRIVKKDLPEYFGAEWMDDAVGERGPEL
jgi:hypothetical protein